MTKRAGISLIELLVVLAMIGIILVATSTAFSGAIGYAEKLETARDKAETKEVWQDKVRDLLQGARVSTSATNQTSCFIGQSGNLVPTTGGLGGANVIAGQPSSTGQGMGLPGGNADTLVFTTTGEPVSDAFLNSTDDWETQNTNAGPQGGVEEVQFGMTAVGDPGTKTGLFLREQRPADADPSQGGTEELLSADIATIQFEFWDGATWEPTWDTRSMTPTRRIPAAVRVTYTVPGEPDGTTHEFVVKIPDSDVTSTNPVTQTTVPGGG